MLHAQQPVATKVLPNNVGKDASLQLISLSDAILKICNGYIFQFQFAPSAGCGSCQKQTMKHSIFVKIDI